MSGISKRPPRAFSSGRYKQRRRFSFLIFLILGLLLIGLGIYTLMPSEYDKNGIQTTAIIQTLDGSDRGYPTVQFEVDGVTYEGGILEYDSTMEVGGKIEIRYMKENPNDFAVANGQSFFSYFYIVLGAFFLIASAFVIISNNKKSLKRINKIKQEGKLIQCSIVGVVAGNYVHSGVNVDTYSPRCYKITCKDSNGYYYTQKNFIDDATINCFSPNFGYVVGDSINVYISNNNPKKFAIDIIEYQERKVKENYINQNGIDNSPFGTF